MSPAVWWLVDAILLGLIACGLVLHTVAMAQARRWFVGAQPEPWPSPLPAVSIMRAVEGAAPYTYPALEALTALEYPGQLEILVGTLNASDPVVPLVGQLQAEHPGTDIRLVFAKQVGANRKTSIMRDLAAQASGDVLVFTDADAFLAPDTLGWIVPALVRPEIGCVSMFPRARTPRDMGSALLALHYEHIYLPQWMLSIATGAGGGTAIGKVMAERREVFEAIGGFDGFLDAIADDYEFANRASLAGFRSLLAHCPIATEMQAASAGVALGKIFRWLRTIRGLQPAGFVGLGATYPLAWSIVLTVLRPHWAPAWAVLGLVATWRLSLALWLDTKVLHSGAFRRWAWLLPAAELVNLYGYLRAFVVNTVTWAGHRYRIGAGGTMTRLDDDKGPKRPARSRTRESRWRS